MMTSNIISAQSITTDEFVEEIEYQEEEEYEEESVGEDVVKEYQKLDAPKVKIKKKKTPSKLQSESRGLKPYKPYFWDVGTLASVRKMTHLPGDAELINMKIKYLQSMLWDDQSNYNVSRGNIHTIRRLDGPHAIYPKIKVAATVNDHRRLNDVLEGKGAIPLEHNTAVTELNILLDGTSTKKEHDGAITHVKKKNDNDTELAKTYLLQYGIYDIFQKLMVDLLTKRPCDPLSHMISLMHRTSERLQMAGDVIKGTHIYTEAPPLTYRDPILGVLCEVISKQGCNPNLFKTKLNIQKEAKEFEKLQKKKTHLKKSDSSVSSSSLQAKPKKSKSNMHKK